VTIQTPRAYISGLPLSLTLPLAALCGPEKAPHLPEALAGRAEVARRHHTDRFAPPRAPGISGMAIAIVLSVLLGIAPKVYAKPIAQSSLAPDDLGTAETEDVRHSDGMPPSTWLFAPLGTPVLSQSTQDILYRGLDVLPAPALGWATVSPLDPTEYQQTFSQRETLEQILRSIATVHSQGEVRTLERTEQPAQGAGRQSINDAQDRGFSELFLHSEMAGDALRAVVDLRTVDEHGVTFSIFGVGNFELDTLTGTHDVMLSDLSNGWSVTLSGSADPNRVQDAADPTEASDSGMNPAPRPHLLRLVVTWALDFLLSPIGILFAILSGLVLLVWAAALILTGVRGSPSRHRRLRRRRLRHAESTNRPRRKRRVALSRHRRSRRRFGKRAPQV